MSFKACMACFRTRHSLSFIMGTRALAARGSLKSPNARAACSRTCQFSFFKAVMRGFNAFGLSIDPSMRAASFCVFQPNCFSAEINDSTAGSPILARALAACLAGDVFRITSYSYDQKMVSSSRGSIRVSSASMPTRKGMAARASSPISSN